MKRGNFKMNLKKAKEEGGIKMQLNEKLKDIQNNYSKQRGITLIALVVTIVVLLILAGVSINALFGQNGIIQRAKDAQNKMDQATQNDLDGLNDLDKLISSLTDKTTGDKVPDELERYFLGEDKKGTSIFELVNEDENGVTFIGNDIIPDAETSIKFKDSAEETENIGNIKIEYKNEYYIVTADMDTGITKTIKKVAKMTVAMFDTGENVKTKINNLIPEGLINYEDAAIFNVAVDSIEKYNGVPDSTKMTEANIVSLELSKFPIYMWFEKSGKKETRNVFEGELAEKVDGLEKYAKEVETGTIYWWSESDNVYLNPNSSQMFAYISYLAGIDGLKDMKTDYVVDMSYMWQFDGKLKNINALAGWNTSKVTNMSNMFIALGGQLDDISALANWNTSNVTDMSNMFTGSEKLANIDALSNWNTANVTNMSYMFTANPKLTNISALSNWNISNVTNMEGMFSNELRKEGTQLSNIDALANWDTSNVTNMSYMFSGNNNLTNIDVLANWDTSKVTNMSCMFGNMDTGGCGITNLSAISNWDVSNVTNMSSMFYGCKKLEDASAIANWKITTIAIQMFFNCINLKNITIPSTVTEIGYGLEDCSNLTKVKILATDAAKIEVDNSGSGAFYNLASNSKIYVLNEEMKAKLEGSYNTSKTTVEVVTLDQMNNL